MENITFEKLKDINLTVSETVEYCIEKMLHYPERPKKPVLAHLHSSKDVEKYQKELIEYENNIISYNEKRKEINDYNSKIEGVLIEYLKERSGLYKVVPKQYQDKVYARAYSDGHSYGHYEVYLKLCNLIEIFE